jgi:hypothetical protein
MKYEAIPGDPSSVNMCSGGHEKSPVVVSPCHGGNGALNHQEAREKRIRQKLSPLTFEPID